MKTIAKVNRPAFFYPTKEQCAFAGADLLGSFPFCIQQKNVRSTYERFVVFLFLLFSCLVFISVSEMNNGQSCAADCKKSHEYEHTLFPPFRFFTWSYYLLIIVIVMIAPVSKATSADAIMIPVII